VTGATAQLTTAQLATAQLAMLHGVLFAIGLAW
jgi:hypothetical protein